MGTTITAIFGVTRLQPAEAAECVLNFFEREFAGELSSFFAKVKYNPEERRFVCFEQEMALGGRDDLMARLRPAGMGMFCVEADMDFAPSDVNVAVFRGPRDEGTTVALEFEKELTTYLYEYASPRVPFAIVLARLAAELDAQNFVAGAEYDHWLPLLPGGLNSREKLGTSPLVVGWRDGVVNEAAVASALGMDLNAVKRTLISYSFLLLFADA